MPQQFEKGDIVELKSGGLAMTVSGTTKSGRVICQWFLNGKVESDSFPPESLKKVE